VNRREADWLRERTLALNGNSIDDPDVSALERLVRNLVQTTLPLCLLSCGGPPPHLCSDPQQVNPPPGVCSDALFGKPVATVEMCGGGLPDGGFMSVPVPPPDCQAVCRYAQYGYCKPLSRDGGATTVGCMIPACTGRRPGRLAPAGKGEGAGLGAFLADAARLEAASVVAFNDLEWELRRLRAPVALRAAARRATEDERRHARIVGELARRHGGPVRALELSSRRVRSLEEIARENAAEGCVRELYGAAVGLWQARAASDPAIRHAMSTIAPDEIRHAELSFALAAWARSRLDAKGRIRVAAARRAAQEEVESKAMIAAPPDLVLRAGIPPPAAAIALARGIRNAKAVTRMSAQPS